MKADHHTSTLCQAVKFNEISTCKVLIKYGLKGGTLDEMANSGERGLVESTSRRKMGHQVEGWGLPSHSQKLWPRIVRV